MVIVVTMLHTESSEDADPVLYIWSLELNTNPFLFLTNLSLYLTNGSTPDTRVADVTCQYIRTLVFLEFHIALKPCR